MSGDQGNSDNKDGASGSQSKSPQQQQSSGAKGGSLAESMNALRVAPSSAAAAAAAAAASGSASTSAPRRLDEAKQRDYKFWATQPVPQGFTTESKPISEPIEEDKPKDQIRQTPYDIPNMFDWSEVDLQNDAQLQELYTLLNENYVEDEDELFRFDYSPAFLRWALQPPGWRSDWHVGVRVRSNRKLVGFISAIPAGIRVRDRRVEMVEINFLCVHKRLRGKRVAPVLIKEITRRVNLTGRFQAVYTGGVVLPKPVATCRYYHRSLNPRKLVECQFSSLQRNMTMARAIKLYKLPDQPKNSSFQLMQPKHTKQAFQLLSKYLESFQLAPVFDEKEFAHWFTPREGIVQSFVCLDPTDSNRVSDFASFYCLPSSVINNPNHKTLFAAYCFYNVAGSMTWIDLMRDLLIQAKRTGFDVVNCLDLMENKQFLSELKFGAGDGYLHYYLYNWRCSDMKAEEVGLVLQ
ncbi:hypothetical protein BOX15_Mlig014540g2 [Macrostomum lignano]|uniref:Glycylpeptide N-tetradecanoyltransferase n=2 Tax=Macrostomum lignano TaxID=282301 RepID=A0A267GM27_9PLAT|nr:hypothetical protein BOX15_Mlig014540g2 [Macrostomum lignano]